MGINKNFVVKNGLEVDSDLILANALTNRVGIGTSLPSHLLHVNGGIAATHISVSGVTTVNALNLNGLLSIGDTYGGSFQYLRATGNGGVEWAPLPELRNSVSYTASEGQTEFTFAPLAAFVDVYINGVKQPEVNYIWTNGLKIELIDPSAGGDIIEIIGYNTNTVGSGGEGSVIGGITIFESGVLKGSAGLVTSINFVGPTIGVTTSGFGVTVYSAGGGGGGESLWASTATGIHTLSNIGIGTTNSPYALTVSGNSYVSGSATVLGTTTLGITTIGSSSTVRSLYVNGGITASGVVTANYYEGDGSRLTNISAQAVDTGWDRKVSGLTTTANIGIGTTNPRYQLEVGAQGEIGINLYVNGDTFTTGNQFFSGVTTSSRFDTDTGNLSITDDTINSPGLITIGGTAVRVTGNFYVNGTQSITSSVYLQVTDKIIGLGTTSATPTDIGADGGGIILYGDTTKEFLWSYDDNSWTSNVNIGLTTERSLRIGGQDVLSFNKLTIPNAEISGISTIGTVSAGVVTASSIYSTEYLGNGNGLSGIVTSIVAGSNISITNSVGRVVISATGSGGGGGDASVSIGDSAPASPSSGKLWWDSTVGRGFIYYVDNDSAQWVDFSPNGGTPSNSIYIKNNGVPLNQAISTIDFTGNVSISTSSSGIATVGVNTTAQGLILTSPNGTQFRLTVDNSGNLSTVQI